MRNCIYSHCVRIWKILDFDVFWSPRAECRISSWSTPGVFQRDPRHRTRRVKVRVQRWWRGRALLAGWKPLRLWCPSSTHWLSSEQQGHGVRCVYLTVQCATLYPLHMPNSLSLAQVRAWWTDFVLISKGNLKICLMMTPWQSTSTTVTHKPRGEPTHALIKHIFPNRT